jgi:hypothetical protein
MDYLSGYFALNKGEIWKKGIHWVNRGRSAKPRRGKEF